jgi:hypothetical protein
MALKTGWLTLAVDDELGGIVFQLPTHWTGRAGGILSKALEEERPAVRLAGPATDGRRQAEDYFITFRHKLESNFVNRN